MLILCVHSYVNCNAFYMRKGFAAHADWIRNDAGSVYIHYDSQNQIVERWLRGESCDENDD